MKEYSVLQFKMLNRQLTEWGIEPLIGYLVTIAAFIGLSNKLFEKTQYAAPVFTAIALSFAIKLSEANRNTFLKNCYSKPTYTKLRLIENGLISLPFIIFLTTQEAYLNAILLLILSTLLSLINFKNSFNLTIPTPFYKHPFEFTSGFRSNLFVYIFTYLLTTIAIYYNNFNLGVFSLLLTILSCLTYYNNPEDKFYVWIFSLTPKEFIRYKLKHILQYTTLLCLPIIVGLSIFFYTKIEIILGFQLLGYLFIFTFMLGKYSVFPEKTTIKFQILLALTAWLPPFLLLIIPYLYIQSIKNLKTLLHD